MRSLVTGAAGFIGSHLATALHAAGHEVIALDIVPDPPRLTDLRGRTGFHYVTGDLTDGTTLAEPMRGVDRVWHFGASADIAGGGRHTDTDVYGSVVGTWTVCEAMRVAGVAEIVFASSSAVYGDTSGRPMVESHGPLLPSSLYGAGKVGAEAFLGAYSAMFGLRAWIFRLGNVIGGSMTRGILRDLIIRLRQDPDRLTLLGDGRQRKSYVLVDDVLDGIQHLSGVLEPNPCTVVNVGCTRSLTAWRVAELVAEELGVSPVIEASDNGPSWLGDQPVVDLDVARAAALGWRARFDGEQAVRVATRRLRSLFDPDCADNTQTVP